MSRLDSSRIERQSLTRREHIDWQTSKQLESLGRALLARDLQEAVVDFTQVDCIHQQPDVAPNSPPEQSPHHHRSLALAL